MSCETASSSSLAGGLVVRVEYHHRERVGGKRVGEHAAHDHRRHDAARRSNEWQAPEAVGAPPAEERMAGEEVDGVDLAEHQPGGVAEALAQVERGCDHLVLATQRKQAARVHGKERSPAESRQVTAKIGDMGMQASALPEAELAGVAVDHQVGTAAEAPLVVARALQQVLVETGRPEVEADAVLAERVAQATPIATERVPGPERFGRGPAGGYLCPRQRWHSPSHDHDNRQQRPKPKRRVVDPASGECDEHRGRPIEILQRPRAAGGESCS
jgi:hypothetical protein